MQPYNTLNLVANFATAISTYFKGYGIIIEPYPDDSSKLDPILQFYCLDASLCLKPILEKYRNVLFTSNTLSPLNLLPKVLCFEPVVSKAFTISLPRNSINPMIMTKGADQLQVCSKFDQRENTGVVRNYGSLLVELSMLVPDGLVCYFPSFKYMEHVIVKWNEMGILQRVLESKLLFIETRDVT